MINDCQDKLNSLRLEEASSIIMQSLIEMKKEKLQLKYQLQKDKEKAEQNYIETDKGDASENQALRNARDELNKVNGNILRNMQTLQSFELIDERNFCLATYDFSNLIEALQNLEAIDTRDENGNPIVDEYGNAIGISKVLNFYGVSKLEDVPGAIREFDYDANRDFCIELIRDFLDSSNDVVVERLVSFIMSYADILNNPEYNSTGLILVYSTVRLRHSVLGDMTYRIYPDTISFHC